MYFVAVFPPLGIYLIEFGRKMDAAVNWYARFGQQSYFIYQSTNELYFYACTFKMTVEIHTCCICSLGSRLSCSASVWLGVSRWHSAIISVEWNGVLNTGVAYRFIDALHVNIMFLLFFAICLCNLCFAIIGKFCVCCSCDVAFCECDLFTCTWSIADNQSNHWKAITDALRIHGCQRNSLTPFVFDIMCAI